MTKLIRSLALFAILVWVLLSCNTPTVVPNRLLTLTTTANPVTYDQVGQTITFTYVIKNSGNVPLGPAQFTVSDSLIGTAPIDCGNNGNQPLAPNATLPPCTATYTIQPADLTAVSIANVATASGGGAGPSQPPAMAMINKSSTVVKALTLTATANPVTYDQVGQIITFTYVIKNSGNVPLGPAQFTITDSLIGATPMNCGPADKTLAPNDPNSTVTCTATYTITQADLTAVSITNIATASGGGAGPSQAASATVNKSSTVVKLLTLTTAANPLTYNQVDQIITFTYVIKNSGNVPLGPAQFTITDSLIGVAPMNCGPADKTLAPNDPNSTVTCTATYTITQADLTAVSITNLATASGAGAGPSQAASATVNKQ